MSEPYYDVVVVGGGINGTGVAADAALRGLSVLLCEQGDLAGATSSASTKLIHGGLRYLEYYEFKLVRQALKEREILLNVAKHLVKPLNFILPHQPKTRSIFEIRLGLFLYDHLAKHPSLPRSKLIKLNQYALGKYLNPAFKIGFRYSDCRTDDARLVITNALQAKKFGANILNYTQCISAKRNKDHWQVVLRDQTTGALWSIKARALINATGAWVDDFLQQVDIQSHHHIQLVKGSHLIVKKFFESDEALIFQHKDNRVIFVIPYLDQFFLIGTTDINYTGDPNQVAISKDEIDYLLGAVNTYFSHQIRSEDIIHTYSGVRPLVKSKTDNPAAVTRDYLIERDETESVAPMITLFGGKLTTYRIVAEKIVDKLQPFFENLGSSKTAKTPLPGAHFKNHRTLFDQLKKQYDWLQEEQLQRYINQYGTRTYTLLADCSCYKHLGKEFNGCLYQREIDYLVRHEWARTTDDILWRRTKLGYHFLNTSTQNLQDYLATYIQSQD